MVMEAVNTLLEPRPLAAFVETPFVQSLGALRQEVAVKLSAYVDSIVKEVTFRIFYEKKNADLGSLPAGLRGAMTGLGNITGLAFGSRATAATSTSRRAVGRST